MCIGASKHARTCARPAGQLANCKLSIIVSEQSRSSCEMLVVLLELVLKTIVSSIVKNCWCVVCLLMTESVKILCDK